jgi:EmrB/QacA subfamily drug resistance transporter
MSQKRVTIVTVGVMLSLFMAAVESTVVATAMPTIVADLGGLAAYSWVFSAYMLTSTTTVPLYGKLSDLYGRRRIFFVSMALFLSGSILSGLSATMGQLIAFRALQGLGAGGLMPLAFIMIGDMLSFEQRARMQGLFSGVWGFAAIVGPLLGGFIVDTLSWHWVFFVNIIPALLSTLLVGIGWRDRERAPGAARPAIDYGGVVLLTAGVVALLLGLFELGSRVSWALLAAAAVLLTALYWVERRAADPILPLPLFRDRLFAVATVQGLLAGWAMFGSTNFIPLFGQIVLGESATAAGSALMPMMLGWTLASIVGGRLLLRFNYRSLALVGMTLLTAGAFGMVRVSGGTSLATVMVCMALMGIGMGLALPAFLIAVQSSVERSILGTATATLQFSRSIGGTLGVSVMGVILTTQLTANLTAAGVDPASVSMAKMIEGGAQAGHAAATGGVVQGAVAAAVGSVFAAALIAAVMALAVTSLAPRGRILRTIPADRRTPEAELTEL